MFPRSPAGFIDDVFHHQCKLKILKGALAIRRIFSLVDKMHTPNCLKVFEILCFSKICA